MNNRPGIRLAIDVGRARVGVARSDPHALLAVPVTTAARDGALVEIIRLVDDFSPLEVVVGLPLSLAGHHTASTNDAVNFAQELAKAISCPVRMVDERLSTVSAMSGLHQAGKSTKSAKEIIDQAAAVILLQHCLDSEKNSGRPPGTLVGEATSDQ